MVSKDLVEQPDQPADGNPQREPAMQHAGILRVIKKIGHVIVHRPRIRKLPDILNQLEVRQEVIGIHRPQQRNEQARATMQAPP